MKRLLYPILTVIMIFLTVIIANLNSTTKQCIDYICHENKIPLYQKALGFFDRHYEYRRLVKNITNDSATDEKRVMKILEWTTASLRHVPQGFPIMDDHVWYIIVRGYGTNDQFQDVFTTLCNYAQINAFYRIFRIDNSPKPLSFVKLGDNWTAFDAYRGVYFKNKKGRFASVEDLLNGDWQVFSLNYNMEIPQYYRECFKNLNSVNYEKYKLSRPAIQSPINRIKFWNKYKK